MNKYPPADWIVSAVLDVTGVSIDEYAGNCRHPEVLAARAVAVGVARQVTIMGYPDIVARVLLRPHRCHSTAISAGQRFVRDQHDGPAPTLRQLADAVIHKLEANRVQAQGIDLQRAPRPRAGVR